MGRVCDWDYSVPLPLPLYFIAMRYAMTVLAAILLAAGVTAGCLFDETDEAAEPTPNLKATIDAALARVAATPATATPSPTIAPTGVPTTLPTDTPPPPSATPRPRPTVPPVPPAYDLAEVRNWEYAGQNAPVSVARIGGIAWIADGLHDVDEFNAAERLVNIAIDAPDTLDVMLDGGFPGDSLEPLDLPALLSLQRMAQDRPERLAQLTGADWFRDGLTDPETAIVAVLYERSRFLSPEFDEIVSSPGSVSVETGYATSRAGESIPIAIIREAGVLNADSQVMAVAQAAVPIFEDMFDAPFPTPAIVIHVTDYVAGVAAGTNYQTHVTLKSEIDANARPEFAPHAIFHEIAHYYLYARPTWYAEGGADFAASYARHVTAGERIEATNSPCAAVASLSELERLLPAGEPDALGDVDLWQCNYALGERLMLALHRKLGEEGFLLGWREIYGILARDPSYPSQQELAEIDIRVAWLRAGGMEMQPELEQIWDQWYRGRASREIDGAPDATPVDPTLPAVNGRIDQAYIALQQGGSAVHGFSASQTTGWVYLTLEYSYPAANSAQELTLEVVEYFEDGFATGRRSVPLPVQLLTTGGTQWLSVGPNPPQRWAPGGYWVYVYESGRKVAEVEFGVTP